MRVVGIFSYVPFIAFVGCKENNIISYTPSQADSCFNVKNMSESHLGEFGLEVLENSLDDTIIFRSIKIAPKRIGEIFYQKDFYSDTAVVCIQKHKATKGVIKIKYLF